MKKPLPVLTWLNSQVKIVLLMLLMLIVTHTQAANRRLPAPPYAKVIQSLPYGVKVRLLLAPADAQGAQQIQLLGADSYQDYRLDVTDNPRVWEGFVYAKSTQKLALSFRVTSAAGESAWSRAITARTSAPPKQPPSAPSALTVTASPFAFLLTWADTASNEYGFEIQRCRCGGAPNKCVVIAFALPNTTRLKIGGFLPNTQAQFRIRALNPSGVSAWSRLSANATTPPIKTKRPSLGVDYYGWDNSCTSFAALRESVSEENARRKANPILESQPDALSISLTQLGPQHPTVTVGDPRECGSAGCEFVVYGTVNGCFRAISGGFREALELGDDWPILAARWHSNAGRWTARYLQMIDGKYQIVDQSEAVGFDGQPLCGTCENHTFPANLPNASTGTECNFDAYQCEAEQLVPLPLLRAN